MSGNGNSDNERAGSRKWQLLDEVRADLRRLLQRLDDAESEVGGDGEQQAQKTEQPIVDCKKEFEVWYGLKAIDVSPDGKTLIAATEDKIWIIDVDSGALADVNLKEAPIYALKFVPGQALAVAGVSDGVVIVDIDKRKSLNYVGSKSPAVCQLAVTSDGRTVIVGRVDGWVLSWDLNRRTNNWASRMFSKAVQALAIAYDGRHVWCGSCDNHAFKLSMQNGNPSHAVATSGPVLSLAAVPRLNNLIIGHSSHFEVFEGRNDRILQCGGFETCMNVCLTKNGNIILASRGGVVRAFYQNIPCELAATYSGHAADVISIVIMPDDKHFVSGARDGSIHLGKLPVRGEKV